MGVVYKHRCIKKGCKSIVRKQGQYCLDCYCQEVTGQSYDSAVRYEARGVGTSGWVESIGTKVHSGAGV